MCAWMGACACQLASLAVPEPVAVAQPITPPVGVAVGIADGVAYRSSPPTTHARKREHTHTPPVGLA